MKVEFKFSLEIPDDVDMEELSRQIERVFYRAERCRDILPYVDRHDIEEDLSYQISQSLSWEKKQ